LARAELSNMKVLDLFTFLLIWVEIGLEMLKWFKIIIITFQLIWGEISAQKGQLTHTYIFTVFCLFVCLFVCPHLYINLRWQGSYHIWAATNSQAV
jgi:hypothetical protein